MDTRQELDKLDKEYPNIFRMPKNTLARYNKLSAKLVLEVWEMRASRKGAYRGSIHSHLIKGEKDGQ